MKTITKFLTLIFITASITAFSQEYKKNIEKEFSAYLQLILNGDFEQSTEYIMEEMFEYIPKETLVSLMESMLNDPDIKMSIKDSKVIEINDSKEIEGKHYAILIYSNLMTMELVKQEDETEEEYSSRVDLTISSLKITFGPENVTYSGEGPIEIYARKRACAVSLNGESQWKFITIQEKQRFLLEKILPKELIEELFW